MLEFLQKYSFWFQQLFEEKGLSPTTASFLNIIITLLISGIVIFAIDFLLRKIIVTLFTLFSNKTKSTFDDFLVKSNFPKYLAHFVPVFIVWMITPVLFKEYPTLSTFLMKLIDVYIVILFIFLFRSILRSTKNYLSNKERYKDKPLDSYMQVLLIFAWGIGIFFTIYKLTGYSIESFATLGATSAVIMLIFKDTILGFVASMQISINDIVRMGDWITFSKYGADGYVTEINLATVKVQNFDNTFTTIPTYSLISESFQNWRGMQESAGRRIKRSFFIKQNSIKFLTPEDITRYKKIELISDYLDHREKDNYEYNSTHAIDTSLPINGKNQTNLGIFRKYIDAYLHINPAINKDMFLMVRYLQPTPNGIPVEIFCFSYDKKWENYEHIQADIIDHIVASVSYFDLELFEIPTGKDLRTLSQ